MSIVECSCVSTVVVSERPRCRSEDLHCRHAAVEDVHVFGSLKVVLRRTFLDLEDCQIADAIESCDKKQQWSDVESQCDTASDIDFKDLSTEDEASSEDAGSPITVPSGPPGVFIMTMEPLCLPAASTEQTDAFGLQLPCADITDAVGVQKSSVVPTDVATPQGVDSDSQSPADEPQTSLILKNISKKFTSASLARRLDSEGFAGKYDFVYVPLDLQWGTCFGYAFVNMALPEDGAAFMQKLRGATGWAEDQALEVDWSARQGLAVQTEKYRNSPLMHASINEAAKPLLFQNGVNVPFLKPTKLIKKPRGMRAKAGCVKLKAASRICL